MKKLLIAIVLIVIVVFVVMFFGAPKPAPSADTATTTETPADTTESIAQDLDAVQVGDIDADFNALDTDINSL